MAGNGSGTTPRGTPATGAGTIRFPSLVNVTDPKVVDAVDAAIEHYEGLAALIEAKIPGGYARDMALLRLRESFLFAQEAIAENPTSVQSWS